LRAERERQGGQRAEGGGRLHELAAVAHGVSSKKTKYKAQATARSRAAPR
jgi:hypothetical protein